LKCNMVNSKQRNYLNNYNKVAAEKAVQKEREKICRRFFKLSITVLHDEFMFGTERSARFINKVSELLLQTDEDEIFWEHIDQLVIDRLDLPFERDWTR